MDNYYFWVPATMPIAGAILGAFVYEIVIGIHVPGAGGQPAKTKEVDHDEDADIFVFQ